jgi:hypothetical protein
MDFLFHIPFFYTAAAMQLCERKKLIFYQFLILSILSYSQICFADFH